MSMNAAQYCADNGIHKVPLWRVAGFALNGTATFLYLLVMTAASWYLLGPVGLGLAAVTAVMAALNLFDGFTDPMLGFIVDRTSGKFGKNRPFMVLGNLIMFIGSFFMMTITDKLPDNAVLRIIFFVLFGLIFFIGYSFQTVVTRSAQACLTNEPAQRAAFGAFEALFASLVLAVICILVPAVGETASFFHTFWLVCALLSAVFTAVAVYSVAPKDRFEFFGTGKRERVSMEDFKETLKSNQAVRILMVASATDRFAMAANTAALSAAMFACLAGSQRIQSGLGAAALIPGGILAFAAVLLLASKLGAKKAVVVGSWGGIVVNAAMACLWLFGDPSDMADPASGSVRFGLFFMVFVAAVIARTVFAGLSSGMIAPMLGDCADYEVYRTGKYIPAMIGAMVSRVDKIAAALAPVLTAVLLAVIGFGSRYPAAGDASTALRVIVVILAFVLPAAALAVNVVVMRKYPLTKEYMAQIEDEIAKVKEESYTRRF